MKAVITEMVGNSQEKNQVDFLLEKIKELERKIGSLKAIINEKNNEIQHLKREMDFNKNLVEDIRSIKRRLEGKYE